MKNILKIPLSFFALMLLATSCKKDNNNEPVPIVIDYDTVPYTFTVDIIPMQDKVEGVELKTAFAPGDKIQITNPHVLYEPLIIPVDGHEGKTSATFSGQMKIKKDLDISSGFALTAALRNGADYNNGKPFVDVQKFNSLAEGVKKYSYWASENVAFNNNVASFSLTQSTVFVDFYMPKVQVTFKKGNAYTNKIVDVNQFFAVPFGYTIEVADFKFEKSLDDQDKSFYKISALTPEGCLPGLFSASADKYVYFSKGTLQYRAMDGAWRLSPQQYDKCFTNGTDVGEYYVDWLGEDKWTDLFWWGGWVEGMNPKVATFDDVEYNLPVDANGGLTAPCAMGAMWTVLDNDEWYYILEERPDAEQKRGGAFIDNIKGFVILPDEWTTPDGLKDFEAKYEVEHEADVPNKYTKDEWAKMESAGAVFIPIIGQLYGTLVLASGFMYQSRSFDVDSEQGNLIMLDFSDSGCGCYDIFFPNYLGQPVRLVQPPGANMKVKVE
ncbi:MAG: hypothetical protein J6V76_03250 [Bacteroidales bacterium]|nr:hypothetical protein [Bacteroidales bacterium]